MDKVSLLHIFYHQLIKIVLEGSLKLRFTSPRSFVSKGGLVNN